MAGPPVKSGEKYMEQISQANAVDGMSSPLEAQLRECFGRVAYAHKTHEKCADICTTKLGRVKFWQIVLSAVTTGGIVTVLVGSKEVSYAAAIVSAILSTILLALNAYMKDNDPGQQAEKHKKVASDLWDVRESYLSLLTDLRSQIGQDATIREKRDALQSRLAEIYVTAPRTTGKGYQRAQEGLQDHEEMTFSDAELDALLPTALRLNQATH